MKKRTLILISILSLLTVCGCNEKKQNGNNTVVLPKHEVIYEINVRNFSADGNFAGVTAEIPRLKELGVDVLWLMPIHPTGVAGRKGTNGSPYSVQNYLEINPDYGTAADFKALIAAAHEAKMKIIIDWVANHTSWDNVWVTEHPDYYAEIKGQRPAPPMPEWDDVVQLDYSNPNLRTAMIEAMKYWVQEFDIDGFRCDYVSGIPVDFWVRARNEIDAIKPLFWLAEGDNPKYLAAFDYDYAWNFSDRLNEFGKNNNVANLKNACLNLFNNAAYADKSKIVYITNHDMSAYNGTEFDRFGANVFAMTTLFFTIYDMPLLYNGQEYGINQSMELFSTNKVQWNNENVKMKSLIEKLIELKHSQPALENGAGRGELTFFDTNKNSSVLVYSRKKDKNEVVVMLNFSNTATEFYFTDTVPKGKFTNYFSTKKTKFSTKNTLNISANGYMIFVKEKNKQIIIVF